MRIVATLVSVLIAGTLSFTIAQEHIPSRDELLQSVIPGLENFNLSSVKTEDIEKVIKEKCEKNGGPEAYGVAKESPASFSQCLQSLVNVTQLQAEVAEARPHRELEEVFKKYCRRVPNLKRCVRNVIDGIEPCLESEERDSVKNVLNFTNSLLEFICHNEGDRIAMFIAADGVECLKAKQQAVGICANETFSSYVQAARLAGGAALGLSSIPMLVLGLEQCRDIESFKTCTGIVLEECYDPTPTNVIDSLLDFVIKVTPCKALLEKSADHPTGDSRFGSQPARPVKTTPSQADKRSKSRAGSNTNRQTSFENSWSKSNSAEPNNQYLPLAEGNGENKRMCEEYEKTKLGLLKLEAKNKRDTEMRNSQLHELTMEKLSLEIERLKEATKYEQEFHKLQITKIKLEIYSHGAA